MMRLTKDIRQQILNQNEGFSTRTFYKGKNIREERIYEILGGKLYIRTSGKGAWADDRYNEKWEADEEETHRFLYAHLYEMNLDGIE